MSGLMDCCDSLRDQLNHRLLKYPPVTCTIDNSDRNVNFCKGIHYYKAWSKFEAYLPKPSGSKKVQLLILYAILRTDKIV